jgi:preprotein translocase SecE subunit
VARPTRQARRERREQQRADRADGAPERARRSSQAVAAPAEAETQPGVHHRGGVIGFIGECWAELQKVDWPNQKQVITGSVVVLVACTIVGTYLWIIDLIIKPLINNVLIG